MKLAEMKIRVTLDRNDVDNTALVSAADRNSKATFVVRGAC